MSNEKRLKKLERRRKRAARLLAGGVPQAQKWRGEWASRASRYCAGIAYGRTRAWRGCCVRSDSVGKLSEAQRKELAAALKQGALAARFATEVVDATAHWLADHTAIRSSIGTVLGVAHPRGAGLECAASGRTSAPARRALDSSLEDAEVAGVKKFQDANSATMTHPIRRRSRRRDLGSKSRRHCGTRNAR